MIQQVYDRVPTRPNRKKLTFESDGHVEFVTEEYADEPTIEGIPYNGFFATNLQGDLYTIDRSVTPNSVEVAEGTMARFAINKTLTSYETGKLLRLRCPTANGTWNNTYNSVTFEGMGLESITASTNQNEVYNAIDGFTDTYWHNADTEYQNVWWRVKFKSAIKIKKMKTYINTATSTYFVDAKIQGSNNGTSWTDLYTISTAQTGLTEITLNNNSSYLYYRILANVTSGHHVYIREVEVTEYEGNGYVLNRPVININGLGYKVVNGTLYAGKDYLLRYSSSQWDIVEGLTNFASGTFGITRDKTNAVNVGFKPKLVILYSARNNASGVAIANNSPYQYHIPIIITDQCSSGKVALTSSGFTINESANLYENILYYIAIG